MSGESRFTTAIGSNPPLNTTLSVTEKEMQLYMVEVKFNASSENRYGQYVCNDSDLFNLLYSFDQAKSVLEYKISCGANTTIHKEHLPFSCNKLVTTFG